MSTSNMPRPADPVARYRGEGRVLVVVGVLVLVILLVADLLRPDSFLRALLDGEVARPSLGGFARDVIDGARPRR